MSVAKYISISAGLVMLTAGLVTLVASSVRPTPPIVSACVKLGAYVTGQVTNSLASRCVCLEATARRQLDNENYVALNEAARVVLEKSLSGKGRLIRQTLISRTTDSHRLADIPIAAADFMLLAHKFSDQCIPD